MKFKIEYEIFLRFGDDDDFYVDVREDKVDADGDIINGGEYVEGHIFDTYKEALVKYYELDKYYETTPSPCDPCEDGNYYAITVNYTDEVKEYADELLNTLNEVKMNLNIDC
tara:strand:+ start:2497 stop:2832 length:336 start_codon:yes stop_codon:yes gene_type:complete